MFAPVCTQAPLTSVYTLATFWLAPDAAKRVPSSDMARVSPSRSPLRPVAPSTSAPTCVHVDSTRSNTRTLPAALPPPLTPPSLSLGAETAIRVPVADKASPSPKTSEIASPCRVFPTCVHTDPMSRNTCTVPARDEPAADGELAAIVVPSEEISTSSPNSLPAVSVAPSCVQVPPTSSQTFTRPVALPFPGPPATTRLPLAESETLQPSAQLVPSPFRSAPTCVHAPPTRSYTRTCLDAVPPPLFRSAPMAMRVPAALMSTLVPAQSLAASPMMSPPSGVQVLLLRSLTRVVPLVVPFAVTTSRLPLAESGILLAKLASELRMSAPIWEIGGGAVIVSA